MSKKVIFIILGAILVIGLSLYLFVGKDRLEEKSIMSTYSFINVEKADVTQSVNIDGIVASKQGVDLRFQANGVIEEINYKIGDKVSKGDIIATLNSNDQEIFVKQGEASLSQANANLNLRIAGSSDEDLAIYQSRVDNAERILESTINSAHDDVKNAEARVASAQVAVESAVTGLEITKKQNLVDLSIAYQNVYSSLDASILTIEKALDYVNDILNEDDNLEEVYSVKNSSYGSESKNKHSQVSSFLKALQLHNNETDNTDYDSVDGLLSETRSVLDTTKEMLDLVSNSLIASITSSSVTQAKLDAYKTGINNLRTETNAARAAAENNEQMIFLIKTNSDIKVVNAESLVNTARATLALENSNLHSVISKLEAQKVQAENSLNLANNELILKSSSPRDVDTAYLKAKVREASASLALANENLNKTKLVSPIDGVIVDIDFEEGESINSSATFLSLTANGKKIEATIPEIEVSKVNVGDEVEIRLDAFADKIFTGTIISIDPVETIIQGVVYYKADIIFNDDNSNELALSGMTADINISTSLRENVLSLPASSIKKDGNKFFVQTLQDDKIKLKDVTVGLIGDKRIEILSGLEESETVVSFILQANSK